MVHYGEQFTSVQGENENIIIGKEFWLSESEKI